MDNNFNQQAPQQPMYQPAPKKPSNINTMELLALILSSVGAFMAILGSIMTCSCSASKTMTITNIMKNSSDGKIHSASAVLWVAIIGALMAAYNKFQEAVLPLCRLHAALSLKPPLR